jgi:glycosyltransferase involved in cell wall biosynthesis
LQQSKVAILLCTYQGQKFLADQVESIIAQTHQNWTLWVSDDGSTDATLAIITDYQRKLGANRVHLISGPQKGFTANFLTLTCHPAVSADYFAYADQDDIWMPDKLERALAWLQTQPADQPALYGSRTALIDEHNHEIGLSPLFKRPPSFRNALVQNIAGGNTMVFNAKAHQLLSKVGPDAGIAAHDWWTYMLVTGCGGKFFYDPRPTVRYRQHSGNLIGVNSNWQARLIRVKMLWQSRFRIWIGGNLAALNRLSDDLTPESHRALKQFSAARKRSLIPRLIGAKYSGIYRQTFLGNMGLLTAVLFKKI